jgi:hypothetical protein
MQQPEQETLVVSLHRSKACNFTPAALLSVFNSCKDPPLGWLEQVIATTPSHLS